jgi:nitroreductase
MEHLTPKSLTDCLRARYATKEFESRKLPEETVTALTDALLLAPSSFGIEAWKFVVVENPETRKKLREASFGQPKVTDASHFVVLCARKEVMPAYVDAKVEYTAKIQGTTPDALTGLRDMLLGAVKGKQANGTLSTWLEKQVYIALGVLIASAAALDIDAGPMEGFDPAKYDAILGLDRLGLHAVVACGLGYRDAKRDKYASLPKVRWPKDEVVLVFR